MIKNFAITGLFGDRDVSIPFDSNVKILVAENGSGKTTLLSALYNVVAGDFLRLRDLEFEKITVIFSNNITLELTKTQIEAAELSLSNDPRFQGIGARLGVTLLNSILEIIKREPTAATALRHPTLRSAAQKLGVPAEHLYSVCRNARMGKQMLAPPPIAKARESVEQNISHALLYFPTYRRVEDDLERLGFSELQLPANEQLIQFGMSDVQKSFEKITNAIKSSSIEWFSKINGQMLTQLVDGIKITDEMRNRIANPEALKIVLDRIGENITLEDKEHILALVQKGNLDEQSHGPLIYFLANLIKVYDQQRENDDAIKAFTSICNEYLSDKEVTYHESKVSIEVVRKKNNEPISIGKLSSGEKQIISLFSKLYLDTSRPTAIFFDEPELSLSIEWQRKLLPHVVESKRCAFLVATTHSPFIFENSLDAQTTDLTEYVKFR